MTIDVKESRSKLTRAQEHLDAYAALAIAAGQHPFDVRVTDIDESSGWCDVMVRQNALEDDAAANVVGDFISNARSALDYLVTALVDASHATLPRSHQFPIHTN